MEVRGSGCRRRVALVLSSFFLGAFGGTAAFALATLLNSAAAAGVVSIAFAAILGASPTRGAGPAVVALVALMAPPARDNGLHAATALVCLLADLAGLLAARL